jgi:DNA-binding CsgD family transcriptional regulator
VLSTSAARLYELLLGAGELALDADVDVPEGVLGELTEAGLVARRGPVLLPEPPVAALAGLLSSRHRALAARTEQLAGALEETLRAHLAEADSSGADPDRRVRLLSCPEEVSTAAAGLAETAAVEVCDVAAAPGRVPRWEWLRTSPAGGVAYRGVWHRGWLAQAGFDAWVAACGPHAVRVRSGIGGVVRIVDAQTVLLGPVHAAGKDAALIHSSVLAAGLRGAFNLLWGTAEPIGSTRAPAALTPTQWRVLRLLAADADDARIAAATQTTVATVRTHVAAICRALGATSRLQAGARAAEWGWLEHTGEDPGGR